MFLPNGPLAGNQQNYKTLIRQKKTKHEILRVPVTATCAHALEHFLPFKIQKKNFYCIHAIAQQRISLKSSSLQGRLGSAWSDGHIVLLWIEHSEECSQMYVPQKALMNGLKT